MLLGFSGNWDRVHGREMPSIRCANPCDPSPILAGLTDATCSGLQMFVAPGPITPDSIDDAPPTIDIRDSRISLLH